MNDKSSQLSDVTLEINSDSISELCTKWESKFLSIDLSSIDIASIFSPLTSIGIGTSYISSLKTAFEKADSLALSTNKTIKETVETQTGVDDKYYNKQISNTSSGGSNNNGYSNNFSNGNNENRVIATGTLIDEKNNGYEKTKDNKQKKIEINKKFIDKINNLDDEKYIKFMTLLENATKGNLLQYIADGESASKLKKVLLKTQDIDPKLWKMVVEMDENELQVSLQNIFTNDAAVTDLSRNIIYHYTESLANNTNLDMIKATKIAQFYNNIDNFFNVINSIKENENLQIMASSIYDGDVNEKISSETVDFFRNAIDKIAENNNLTSNELLNNSVNNEKLKKDLSSLAKDLSFFKTVNTMGDKASELLYNGIIKKEEYYVG